MTDRRAPSRPAPPRPASSQISEPRAPEQSAREILNEGGPDAGALHRCRVLVEWWDHYPDTDTAEQHVATVAAQLAARMPGASLTPYAEPNPPLDERGTDPEKPDA